MYIKKFAFFVLAAVVGANVFAVYGQTADGDGTPTQRLEVMRQKLEIIRKSAASAASALEQEEKVSKEDKKNVDTPVGRLKGIEKDAGRLI